MAVVFALHSGRFCTQSSVANWISHISAFDPRQTKSVRASPYHRIIDVRAVCNKKIYHLDVSLLGSNKERGIRSCAFGAWPKTSLEVNEAVKSSFHLGIKHNFFNATLVILRALECLLDFC